MARKGKGKGRKKTPARDEPSPFDDPNVLAATLAALSGSETVKVAEESLKPYLKLPKCILGLMQQLRAPGNAANAQVRHMAVVILRKRLSGHWSALAQPMRNNIKSELLLHLSSEPERGVRRAASALAGTIASRELAKGHWPELLQFIIAAAQHTDEQARELAYVMLEDLTPSLTGSKMVASIGQVVQMLKHTLTTDASKAVKLAAMSASCSMCAYLSHDKEVVAFSTLVPDMATVAAAAAAEDDDLSVMNFLENFSALAESPQPIVHAHLPQLVPFLVHLMRQESLEPQTRDSAALGIATLAEWKPKLIGKLGLVPPIIGALMEIIATTKDSVSELFNDRAAGAAIADAAAAKANGGDDSDSDDSESSPGEFAQTTLDVMALHVPMKYFFKPAVAQCLAFWQRPDPAGHKAAAITLGVIAEGCQDPIREQLHALVPHVISTASNNVHPQSREAACFCLGQLSEHCQPELLEYTRSIVPVMYELLRDPNENVSGTSCYVLEQFVDKLAADEMKEFVEPLTTRLVQLLQSTERVAVKQICMSAIAAVALGAEDGFIPYVQHVAPIALQLAMLTEESQWTLRGQAMQALAHLAIAVGIEPFRPYLEQTMLAAKQCLEIDDMELREYTYILYANLAKVFKGNFAGQLDWMVNHLCDTLRKHRGTEGFEGFGDADDGILDGLNESDDEDAADGEDAMGGAAMGQTGGDDEDDDDDDDEEFYLLTPAADMHKAALAALGALAEYSGPAFGPHIQGTMQTICEASLEHGHEPIRSAACEGLQQCVKAALAAQPPQQKFVPGELSGLPQQVQHLTHEVVKILLQVMKEDDDPKVVASSVEALQEVLESAGPAALSLDVPGAASVLLKLAQEKSPCQNRPDHDDDDDDDDGEGDHDNVLMDVVADLTGAYAKVLADKFTPFAAGFCSAFGRFAHPKRPASDRAMAIGCFAELIKEVGPALGAYFGDIMPLVKAGLADVSGNVRRNSAYCAGVLCAAEPVKARDHVMELLQLLSHFFQPLQDGASPRAVKDHGAARDNAAATVCRLIGNTDTAAVIPIGSVLPAVMKALPLSDDPGENDVCYQTVLGLCERNAPELAPLMPDVTRVLCKAGEADGVREQDVPRALRCIAVFARAGQADCAAALASMPEQLQQSVLNSLA